MKFISQFKGNERKIKKKKTKKKRPKIKLLLGKF